MCEANTGDKRNAGSAAAEEERQRRVEGEKMEGHLNIWKMNQQRRGGYYVSR